MLGLERLRRASKRTLVSRTRLFKGETPKSRFHVTDLVQLGISEKVTLAVSFTSAFLVGFILAYARSWRLSLALSSILPCMGIVGGLMSKFVSKYTQWVTCCQARPEALIFVPQVVLEACRRGR
jgi:hypothetical protein